MSTNDQIVEALARHQVMIQRLGSGNYKKLEPILKEMSKDIRRQIRSAGTEFSINRMQKLLDDVNAILRTGSAKLADELVGELSEFMEYEAEFNKRMVTPFITIEPVLPPVEKMIAALTTTPTKLVSGSKIVELTIKQLVEEFSESKRKEIDSIIRGGFIQGKTSGQMIKEIRSMFGKRTRQQAATLVRTATNHAGSEARKAFAEANRNVIVKEEWLSTLDGRTTIVCMTRDGKTFNINEGPYPPAHYGCRSLRVPIVDPKFSVFGTDKGTRASKDGPVSANLTYAGFLRKQSKAFQDDVLGPERAKLFRSGKLTLDKFVDDMGRTLTLEELREREFLLPE